MGQKNLCIIQARVGSTRLPGKVLLEVDGISLLEYQIKRVKQAKRIDKIVIATTTREEDDKLENLCKKINIDCFCGSENDVLDRYYQCAQQYPGYENIIRITGDCPLIDPVIIDQVVNFFERNNFDYASNVGPATFPDGMDVEIFNMTALEKAVKAAELPSEREHVTQYIRKDSNNKKGNFLNEKDYSHWRLTVDEPNDFEVVKFLIKNSSPTANYLDYISLLTKHPEIMMKNTHIIRNEGLLKSLKKDKII